MTSGQGRRRRAEIIRARQELGKRIESLLPTPRFACVTSLEPLLAPSERHIAAAGLRELLATRSALRYPGSHLEGCDRATLAERDRYRIAAEKLLDGEWSIFGRVIPDVRRPLGWVTHPFSDSSQRSRHWHRTRHDTVGVGGDVKYLWELNRHAHLLRLAQGYFLSGDDRFAHRCVELLTDWSRQNPPRVGINWTSSLEIAFRAIAWCWIWQLTRSSRAWTDDALAEMLWQLWHHARHMERYDSVHHSPNTHLTGEALGLLYVARSFPEFAHAHRWAARATTTLEEEIRHQILPDGMHGERSTGYHRYTLEIYLHAALLTPRNSRAGCAFRAAVARLSIAAAALRLPGGGWPVLGDEDGGRVLPLSLEPVTDQQGLLATAEALTMEAPEPRGPAAARSSIAGEAWWLLDRPHLAVSARSTTSESMAARPSIALPYAGYYVARDEASSEPGWYCLVDAGPHSGALRGHAHTDIGHVEIARGRTRIVADPGSSTYNGDPRRRRWLRSEHAHACLVVDDAPLAVSRGAWHWERVPSAPHASVRDDGSVWMLDMVHERQSSEGGLTHRRQVVLVRGTGVLVCDWVKGAGHRALELHWPLPCPIGSVGFDQTNAIVDDVAVTWAGATAQDLPLAGIVPSWHSPSFGEETEGSMLVLRREWQLPWMVLTAFTDRERPFRILRVDGGFDVVHRDAPVIVFRPGAAPRAAALPKPTASAAAGDFTGRF